MEIPGSQLALVESDSWDVNYDSDCSAGDVSVGYPHGTWGSWQCWVMSKGITNVQSPKTLTYVQCFMPSCPWCGNLPSYCIRRCFFLYSEIYDRHLHQEEPISRGSFGFAWSGGWALLSALDGKGRKEMPHFNKVKPAFGTLCPSAWCNLRSLKNETQRGVTALHHCIQQVNSADFCQVTFTMQLVKLHKLPNPVSSLVLHGYLFFPAVSPSLVLF